MDTEIQNVIKQLGIIVLSGDLDCPGRYVPDLNAIFIDEKLNEAQHRGVLVHELCHAAYQQGESEIYHQTMVMQLKLEYEANKFMISSLLNTYLKLTDEDPRDINYLEFMRQNYISSKNIGIVKEVISEYLAE